MEKEGRLAFASLVLSIAAPIFMFIGIGYFGLYFSAFSSLLAILTGIFSLKNIRKSEESHLVIAIIGITLGGIGLAIFGFLIVFATCFTATDDGSIIAMLCGAGS